MVKWQRPLFWVVASRENAGWLVGRPIGRTGAALRPRPISNLVGHSDALSFGHSPHDSRGPAMIHRSSPNQSAQSLVSAAALLSLACLPVLVLCDAALAQEKDMPAEIPIRRVVMFSSGVAFFEHGGEVEGNAAGRSEVQRRGHQRPAQEHGPAGRRRRADFDRQLRLQGPDHADAHDVRHRSDAATRRWPICCSQIRGEQIEIDAPTKIAGTIVGVETRRSPAGKDQVVEVEYLNLLTDDGLRSVSLDNVGRIKLANAKLDAELRQALAVLAAGKSQDKKTVSLNFLGEGKRPVRVGYIQETPIWKTSYRLVLADDEAALPARLGDRREHDRVGLERREPDAGQRPADFVRDGPVRAAVSRRGPWCSRSCTRRCGRGRMTRTWRRTKRSFASWRARMRPWARQTLRESWLVWRRCRRRRRWLRGRAPPSAAGGALAFGLQRRGEGPRRIAWSLQGGQSVAQASDVGEMFHYTIATPVKLPRSQSAMLPIVNESVQGREGFDLQRGGARQASAQRPAAEEHDRPAPDAGADHGVRRRRLRRRRPD